MLGMTIMLADNDYLLFSLYSWKFDISATWSEYIH